jgi:hypothetical protein
MRTDVHAEELMAMEALKIVHELKDEMLLPKDETRVIIVGQERGDEVTSAREQALHPKSLMRESKPYILNP